MLKDRTRVITLNNQKGGVAKTTVSMNLAFRLAQKYGYRVLILDLDSQGNVGTSLGYDPYTDESLNSIENLLMPHIKDSSLTYSWDEVKDYIYTPTYIGREKVNGKWSDVEKAFGFDITLATSDLSIVDLTMGLLSQNRINAFYIYDLIECLKNQYIWDYIVIDTPPALSSIAVNALAAGVDGVIIPSTPELNSFKGIRRLISSVNELMDIFNERGISHRGILGIVLSSFRTGRTIDLSLQDYVKEYYPVPTFKTQIRESSDARKASATLYLFSQINAKAEQDFDALAEEVEFAVESPDGWAELNKKIYEKESNNE